MFYISQIKLNWYGHLSFDKAMGFKPGVNLLIGKNGSGKTSLLRMIDGLSRNTTLALDQEAQANYSEGSELAKLTCKEPNDEDSTAVFRRQGSNGSWQNYQALQQRVRFITSDRKVNMTSAASNPIPSISRDITMPEPGAEIDISLEFTNAILKDVFAMVQEVAENRDIAKELVESYQEGLVDFEKDIKLDLKRSQNPIYFTDFREREIPINNLSSGEKEYLYFYAFLRRVHGEKDKVILIDEPELHLHSSQLRKLCEMITAIADNNQVIIATHSGEILQSFIDSNIVLLDRGRVINISTSWDLKRALEEIGLPVDPSIFTATWICAENDPNVPLKGELAPKTPTVLGWLFGKNIKKRFWSFGGDWHKAEAILEGVDAVATRPLPISLHIILDGDKRVKSHEDYPPLVQPENEKLNYWGFWELENLFLMPELLNTIIAEKEGVAGFDMFWEQVRENKEVLFRSLQATVVRNQLRKYSVDKIIKDNPEEDLTTWKNEVAGFSFDRESLRGKFEKVLAEKEWRWIPGKEALGILVRMEPKFWSKIEDLRNTGKLSGILQKENSISSLVRKLNS